MFCLFCHPWAPLVFLRLQRICNDLYFVYKFHITHSLKKFKTFQDTDYACIVKMPTLEFSRICRDLSQFGESIGITCTKDGIQFSASGDIGSGIKFYKLI